MPTGKRAGYAGRCAEQTKFKRAETQSGQTMKPVKTNLDIHNRVVKEFENESDRGAAVLAGSLAENYLAKYMKSYMVDDPKIDCMFEGFGPFADFNKRIECAYSFKLIPKEQKVALDSIKKIRNHFAHKPFEASFDKAPISDWCKSIPTKNLLPESGETSSNFSHMKNRDKFMVTISLLIANWEVIMNQIDSN